MVSPPIIKMGIDVGASPPFLGHKKDLTQTVRFLSDNSYLEKCQVKCYTYPNNIKDVYILFINVKNSKEGQIMNFVQLLSTYASIISIPLALYFARKTAATTSDKARLEIIKTLSYKLSIEHALTYDDIYAVYCSKLREHKTLRVKFGIIDIVHDLQADIMSNAFIENSLRSEMLVNLSHIEIPTRKPVPYGDSKWERWKHLMVSLLYPTLVGLIIANVVLFVGNITDFIDKVLYTINYYRYCLDHAMVPPLREWYRFFRYSHLNISIPCLIAWSILYVACKHNSYFNRHP